MTTNQYKKQDKQKADQGRGNVARFFSDMLDGSMLTRNTTSAVMPFVLYLSGIAMFLIFNTYYAEKKAREAGQLRREMTELRIRYIQTKSDHMYLTKQSELARRLKARGFIESTEPPMPVKEQPESKGFFGSLFGQNR